MKNILILIILQIYFNGLICAQSTKLPHITLVNTTITKINYQTGATRSSSGFTHFFTNDNQESLVKINYNATSLESYLKNDKDAAAELRKAKPTYLIGTVSGISMIGCIVGLAVSVPKREENGMAPVLVFGAGTLVTWGVASIAKMLREKRIESAVAIYNKNVGY